MNRSIYHLHAEVCKTLSNAKRLEILNLLRDEELSAGDIVRRMKVSKANVSQHLAVLRKAGIVATRRDGVTIFYRISSPKVIKACDLMREVLIEHHSQKHSILKRLV
ncbi:MAG: winged helix-turn-helix transcriptional regulator [Ignavibacteriae bacterium]|nr:winged helix-turn-helix transcriptional regulator [Ignavibacteriota bacterium]